MKKYFLGVDIGTFESKGVLVDGETFRIVESHTVPHGMENPFPNHFEHDAENVWWKDYCAITHAIIEKSGIAPEQIACIGTSTLGCDCLPVDENLNPLRKAILYGIDARASKEIEWLENYYGPEKMRALMKRDHFISDDIAPKILWIKNHEPEVYEKTYKFLTGTTFITARLTGEFKSDHFLQQNTVSPLYREDWSINEEECGIFCRPDQLPQCAYSTDIIGYVTPWAAEQTGLAVGTPVIAGTGDSTAESISGGLTEPGNVLMQFGSTLFFYYCVDRLIEGRNGLRSSGVFTIPGTYCFSGGNNATGTLTRWVRDTLYYRELEEEKKGGENAYSIMAREAAQVPAGSEGLIILPYIFGERSPINDLKAKGMLFGLDGKHTRAHINRAALESIGYVVRQHLELFESVGAPPKSVTIAGGGTKNPEWMQIVADITGVEITVSQPWQTSSYGDAMMAAIGEGTLKDFSELKAAMPACPVMTPNMEYHHVYSQYYPIYVDLYQRNKDLMHTVYDLNSSK